MSKTPATVGESLFGVLTNSCPNCFEGSVFGGLLRMNPTCPNCGLRFEREQGYFLGAMSLGYAMGFVVVLPLFLFLLFQDLSLAYVVGIPSVILVFMSPVTFRLSRLIWLHFDFRVHAPDFKIEKSG